LEIFRVSDQIFIFNSGGVISGKDTIIGGSATPGTQVVIALDGQWLTTVTAGTDGRWTIDSGNLPDGEHALTANSLNAAGQITASAQLELDIDPTAEEIPALSLTYNPDTGYLLLNGTIDPQATSYLAVDGVKLGAITNTAGLVNFQTTLDLAQGDHVVEVVSQSPKGPQASAVFAVEGSDASDDLWYEHGLATGARGVALGDSLIEYNNKAPDWVGSGIFESAQGGLNWAQVLDPRWDFTTWLSPETPNGFAGGNAGIAGAHLVNTISNALPDIWSQRDVPTQRNADFVIVEGGTNDINSHASAEFVIAALKQLIDYELDQHIFVVVSTIAPRIVNPDPTAPSRGWPADDPRWAELDKVNAWIRETYGDHQVHGTVLADVAAAVQSPIGLGIDPQYTRDGTHFSTLGGYVTGLVYQQAIAQIVAPGVAFDTSSANSLNLNPDLTGSHTIAGTAVSGTAPDNYQLIHGAGTSGWTATGEAVNHDGGQAFKITFSGGTGTGQDYFTMRPTKTAVNVGDDAVWVRFYVKVDVSAWGGWGGLQAQIDTGDGVTSQTLRPLQGTAGDMPTGDWTGWLVTDPVLVKDGVATVSPVLQFMVGNASGTGSVSVESFSLRAVDDPGVAAHGEQQVIRGTNGDDTLLGGGLDSYLYGGSGQDALYGGAGADVLAGGSGADRIYGGTGVDTAKWDGPSSAIAITALGGGSFALHDTRETTTQNDDIITGVENIEFSDGSIWSATAGHTIALSNAQLMAFSAPGTLIGTLSENFGGLAEGGYIWRLDDDADGLFALSGNKLVAGNLRASEQTTQPTLTITAIDANGLEIRQTFTITIAPNPGVNLTGSANADTLSGTGGNDHLYGGAGDDILVAHGGYDTLDGGAGIDLLSYADDWQYGATAGIAVTYSGAGKGTITDSWGDTDIFTNVEGIIGTGSDDRFVGSTGANPTFYGLAGNDYFYSGPSASPTTVSYALDATTLSPAGLIGDSAVTIDLLQGYAIDGYGYKDTLVSITNAEGSQFGDTIKGSKIANILRGGGGDDVIYGYEGNDTIEGGTGHDTLIGGLGNDTYSVDDATDTIIEAAGEGTDTVNATASYTLSANIEKLNLVGGQSLEGTGNDLANTITGNGANNHLFGLGGNDTLTGGAGQDTIDGGAGTDQAIFGGASTDYSLIAQGGTLVQITDLREGSPDGADTLVNVEYVKFADGNFAITSLLTQGAQIAGTMAADKITPLASLIGQFKATAYDDTIYTYDGNDTIDGGLGKDTMVGGSGNDTYTVDSAGDVIVELAGEGTDLVNASVSYSLSANVEKLVLTGSAALDGTGNDLANALTGNAGDNALFGMMGNDTIIGGAGNDTVYGGYGADILTGGDGADWFVFNALETTATKDTIKDFAHGIDRLVFDHTAFAALANAQPLDASQLAFGKSATTAAQHLIYNASTGALYYDADGVGGAAQIQVALFSTKPMLEAGDFMLI